MDVAVGISLGILMGILSGLATFLLVKTVWDADVSEANSVIKIVGSLLTIPSTWFSGPFLSSNFFATVPVMDMIGPYMISLSSVFGTTTVAGVIYLFRRGH